MVKSSIFKLCTTKYKIMVDGYVYIHVVDVYIYIYIYLYII